MADLSCKYMGLNLRNPIIVGSSGLTSSIENLRNIDSCGAGAVVLKSIFEEQIRFETEAFINSGNPDIASWQKTFSEIVSTKEYYYDEAFEYLSGYARDHTLKHYLDLITKAKNEISIPVIASINCSSRTDWQFFARRIQEAGADALELNVYILPSDFTRSSIENETAYKDIIREVLKYVSIPVSLKTGFYFSSLAKTLHELSQTGIKGLTLFNRPYNPDIDIDNLQVSASNIFSNEHEYSHTLRWVALLSGRLGCNIAASTGIHNHESVIKQILAGADVVHMASAFYKQHDHFSLIPEMVRNIDLWMEKHNFRSISDFKGLLSSNKISNPATFERVQFLRLFSSIE
ncbi:MAG TPA: dihydroorotate dehydrogenase-like protein [Bacteroidales bacterium]|nr:dihydroorotate dehydrogenase-like protein [Bacteroidales bacterium]